MSISDACIVTVASQTNLNDVFLRDISGSSTITIHNECITQIMAENLSPPHTLLSECHLLLQQLSHSNYKVLALPCTPPQRRRRALLFLPSFTSLTFSFKSLSPRLLYILKVICLSAAIFLTLSVISAAISLL